MPLSPIWQHLPLHFKQDVVGLLDIRSRLRLQICSKKEQALVRSCPLQIGQICVSKYFESPLSHIKFSIFFKSCRIETIFPDLEQMVTCFASTLFSSPLSKCNSFIFNYRSSEFARRFAESLKNTLNWPMKFNKLAMISRGSEVVDVLRVFKSLETLILKEHSDLKNAHCEEIMGTEQWKNLKALSLPKDHEFKLGDLLHLEQISVDKLMVSVEEVNELIESFRTRPLPLDSFFSFNCSSSPITINDFHPNFLASLDNTGNIICLHQASYPTTSKDRVLNVHFYGPSGTNTITVMLGCVEDVNEQSDSNTLQLKVYRMICDF